MMVIIDLGITQHALKALNVDEHGLDDMDNRILLTIIEKFKGGPVGITTIATAVGEEAGTLEEVYEPFLIQEGFLQRTPRGREVTEKAYRIWVKFLKGKVEKGFFSHNVPAFNFLNLRSNSTNDRQGRSYVVDNNSHRFDRYRLQAQSFNPNYNFKHLNVQNGLTQNLVYHFLQDSRGYMWIGTHNGLHCTMASKPLIFYIMTRIQHPFQEILFPVYWKILRNKYG